MLRAEGSGGTMVNVTHLSAAERTARGSPLRPTRSGLGPLIPRTDAVELHHQQEGNMQAETDYDESTGTGWKTFAGIMIITVA
jgi:hypothetical protein